MIAVMFNEDQGWQSGELAQDLARALFPLTSHRRSDVRFDSLAVVDPRAGPWDKNRVCQKQGSCSPETVWSCRPHGRLSAGVCNLGGVGTAFLHALDSQVCLAILVKGRTSTHYAASMRLFLQPPFYLIGRTQYR
eukprot:2993774-Amphidinium_carterae.1